MTKPEGAKSAGEILASDVTHRQKFPDSSHGTSKHRKARVQKYVSKEHRKRKNRRGKR